MKCGQFIERNKLKWLTVLEWEKNNKKELPYFASVWHYDAYGECWEVCIWNEIKGFYKDERNQPAGEYWNFQCEPMLVDLDLPSPSWGEGALLKRNV